MDSDEVDILSSDLSDVELDLPEDRGEPSAASIFSLLRYRSIGDRDCSTDTDTSSDSDVQQDEEYPKLDEHTRSLPCDHQYLGELEPVRGREIMDDNSVQKIPVIFLPSRVVLVPGQMFPFVESEGSIVSVLKYAVEHNHIFGIIPSFLWDNRNIRKSVNVVIGTTAEIIAYGQTEDGFKIKAIGRQRFKILQVKDQLIDDRYVLFAYIRILPEINLPSVLHGYQLSTLNRIRSSQRFKCLRREASQTRWPFWVHRFYDEKHLVNDVKRKFTSDFRISKHIKYPDDASALFFQLLKSVPIPHKLMLEGMALNNPIQRLLWLKNVIKPKTARLKCVTCKATIGNSADIFAMSAEGPHGTYVNPGGYVHELITLKKAKHVMLTSGEPETSFSWFPNYAWQIMCCTKCQYHVGWKFTACEQHLNPRTFYAIKNDAVKVKNVKQKPDNSRNRRLR